METIVANHDAPAPSALQRRVALSLTVAELDKDIDQRLKRLARNMKMPGFRPGKVPAQIVRQQYGEQARQDALSEALKKMFSEAVTAQQLRVAGAPTVELKSTDNTTHIEFLVTFEVYPEIVLNDITGLEVERPVLEVGPAEIDRTLDILRKQRVRYDLVDRPAASADRVSIDFFGKKDGEPFAGGQGQDYRFVLGEGKMLSDFENAVIGTRPGEAKSFEMTFPAEYFAKDLAGQSVTFDITVKEVGEPVLPDLDADFAVALGVVDGDVVRMRAEIEENLRREVKKRLQARISGQVMDALLKANPIDVPGVLIERETERVMQLARQDLEQRGMKMKDLPMQREWFVDQARRRVSLSLLLSEIVRLNDLQAKPARIKALVEEAAQSYDHPEEVVRWYYAQPERLGDFENAAIEANVVEWVLGRVKVLDKPVAFAELMGQPS
ncbi:MAG: trigger factor [Candidatus Accumulibacter sp. UW26]|jgi:trigger factor